MEKTDIITFEKMHEAEGEIMTLVKDTYADIIAKTKPKLAEDQKKLRRVSDQFAYDFFDTEHLDMTIFGVKPVIRPGILWPTIPQEDYVKTLTVDEITKKIAEKFLEDYLDAKDWLKTHKDEFPDPADLSGQARSIIQVKLVSLS